VKKTIIFQVNNPTHICFRYFRYFNTNQASLTFTLGYKETDVINYPGTQKNVKSARKRYAVSDDTREIAGESKRENDRFLQKLTFFWYSFFDLHERKDLKYPSKRSKTAYS